MGCCNTVPPDLDRCQGTKRIENAGWQRCKESPAWVATDSQLGPEGLAIATSLCDECKQLFEKQPEAKRYSFDKL